MSTSVGRQAEDAAASYLSNKGFTILEQNWRTRACEIDVVAKKDTRVYFVEVKYRSSTRQGSGLDYITPKKLKQMQFAAESWVNEQKYTGDYSLSAIEVSGGFRVAIFIESIL